MQSKGADVDIVTGKPVEMDRKAGAEERKAAEEQSLQRQAELAGLTQTDAGRLLIGLVSDQLQKRIEQLIGADPEASAYEAILKEMGNKDRVGRTAMQKIVAARLGQAL